MRTGEAGRAVALVLAAIVVAGAWGCAPAREDGVSEGSQPSVTRSPAPAGAQVLMLGRSVMRGWFDHWGYDGTSPVEKDGYTLTYREIEGPDTIGRSASEAIAEAPPGSTVFFKFCFVDFTGDTDELERNKGYTETVVDAAEKRGVTLVIGNALPRTEQETHRELIAEHRAYNAWLEEVEAAHRGAVRVFDMYSVLSGEDGALKPGYAQGPEDAHLTEAAYEALDAAFFEFLGRR